MPNIASILQEMTVPYTFNNLNMLINASGLEYLLQGNRPVTLFAPRDQAFELLSQCTAFDLQKNVTQLSKLIQYHIVPLNLTIAAMRTTAEPPVGQIAGASSKSSEREVSVQVPTISDQALTVIFSTPLRVNGVKVVVSDIEAENGMLHIVENILWPPGLTEETFVAKP